jgi:hypothetical protein
LNINSGFEELLDLDLKSFRSVEWLEIVNCNQTVTNLDLLNYPTLLRRFTLLYNGKNFKVEDIKKDKIICYKTK